MLSKLEKRFVKTPTSFLTRKRAYTKRQLEKKITKTAEDIGLLIGSGYDISEIIDSIISNSNNNSDNRVKHIMEKILMVQKILDGLGDNDNDGVRETTVTEPTISKKVSDSKKSDSVDDDENWDV